MYFFDTYALIELALENSAFARFIESEFVVSPLNIGEFYSFLVRTYGKTIAKEKISLLSFKTVSISQELMIEATEFKLENNKKELSWADCIGYIAAKRLGLKFLTGDPQFKDFPNVEFVR